MRDLGRVEDGRAHQRAVHAPVGDGKGPPAQIFQAKRAVFDLADKTTDRLFNPGKVQSVGIAHHRHHQPFFGANRDADVVIIFQHNLITLRSRH